MSYMFTYCSALQSLNISSFDTSNVTDMIWMFEDCDSLSEITVGEKFITDGLNQLPNATWMNTATGDKYQSGDIPWGTAATYLRVSEYFTDVDAHTPHFFDIDWIARYHISEGFKEDDGTYTYRPFTTVKRCDMAAFLYRLANSPDYTPSDEVKTMFTDVDENTYHAKEIWWVAENGITTGFEEDDGSVTFRPLDTIKRCDMAAFIHRFDNYAFGYGR